MSLDQVPARISQILEDECFNLTMQNEDSDSDRELSSEEERIQEINKVQEDNLVAEIQENEISSPKQLQDQEQVWTLRFDGSKSRKGNGAGYELISPSGETYLSALRL